MLAAHLFDNLLSHGFERTFIEQLICVKAETGKFSFLYERSDIAKCSLHLDKRCQYCTWIRISVTYPKATGTIVSRSQKWDYEHGGQSILALDWRSIGDHH